MRFDLRRTAARLASAAVSLVLIAGGTVSVAAVKQPELDVPPLDAIHCASYCVYDKTKDEIVISLEPDKRIYPASQTKILTCILALDYLNVDDRLTVSQNAMNTVTSDSSKMGIGVGEKLYVSELLYGLMLPSGNDAAAVLAEGVVDKIAEEYPKDGGKTGPDGIDASFFETKLGMSLDDVLQGRKIAAFAELMNLRAERCGCTGSHFMNPSGLHDDNHYTTANDLTRLMANASENKNFKTLISSTSHIFKSTNLHKNDAWSYVKNSDNLLFDPWLCSKTAEKQDTHMAALIGGKTGTTSKAGKGLTLYTVNENGHELMVSVCGIPADYYYYNTMYVASVTAYGNYECWKKYPESVVIGSTGDYRTINAPDEQQPRYDSLKFPGDKLVDYFKIQEEEEAEQQLEEATPTPTPTPSPTPHPIVALARDNKVLTISAGGLVAAIIVINIILMVRIHKLKKPGKRRKAGNDYIK